MVNCEDVQSWVWSVTAADLERGDRMDARLHIARCGACAAAEKEARSLDAHLCAAVLSEPIDTEAVRRHVLARVCGSKRTWLTRTVAMRMAAAVLFVITAAGAWVALISSTPLETLARQHHRDEVLGVDRQPWVTEQGEIVSLLGARINASPSDAIAVVANSQVRAARLCQVGGVRQVHLLLAGPQGPVSLFICLDAGRRHILASEVAARDGLRSAAVASDHLTVIVVGPMSDEDATQLAKRTWSALVT